MFPEWTWILGMLIGAAIGSFLNVCIYRLPRGMSIGKPTYSFCPTCEHRLTGPDLVPLFSWLFLRGKCRHCKANISPRYLIVELINGGLWAALWWQHLIVAPGDPLKGIAYALFGSALLVAIVTDLEHYIIPDEINAFLLVVGFGYHAFANSIMTAVWGALAGWGILWGVALLGRLLFGKDAMGHGDIKMARGMGALLGPLLVIAAFFIAVIIGAVGGIAQVLLRRRAESGKSAVSEAEDEPYVPESIPSLFKCGFGYLACLDVAALFAPGINRSWFGEEPQTVEEIDDWEPDATAIPFGPYLAVGAVAAAVFALPLTGLITDYFNPAGGQSAMLEHAVLAGGPYIV